MESLEGRQLLATSIRLSGAGPITPFEGSEFRGAIAKFRATNLQTGKPVTDPLLFGGVVNWDDGTTSKIGDLGELRNSAWVESDGRNGFYLMGRHTWTSEKQIRMSVLVTTMDGSANTTIVATARDAPKSIKGQSITMGPGLWHHDAPVARFTDTNPNSNIGEFKAFITYTDPATRRPRTINGSVFRHLNQYIVYSPREWHRKGTFNLRIQVQEIGGINLIATGAVREL